MEVNRRNIGLDILRAAAILGVFLCHGLVVRLHGRDLMSGLGTGVELFFVLSGFLIGRIYFRSTATGSFSFWDFWRSRWWRTLPPYLAAILFYLAVHNSIHYPPLAWYYAFFLQNYLGITGFTFAGAGFDGFGPSWSLCVEEHFYLALPILGLAVESLFGRRSFRYLLPAAIFVPGVLRALSLLFIKPLGFQWGWYSHLHCEGLVAGVFLAYLFVEERATFDRAGSLAKWLLPIVPAMLVLVTFWDLNPWFANTSQFTIYAVGYAAWVRYLYDLKWDPAGVLGRTSKLAAHGVAICSYSVYLTHTTVDRLIRNPLDAHGVQRGIAKSLFVLSATFLAGVIFYFLVERPTILSRDRFLKRRPRPIVEGPTAVEVSS